jgi:spermidine/putrescine transport system permease protein
MELETKKRSPNTWAWFALAPLILWVVFFVVIPTVFLVVMSFAERDALGRVVYTFSFQNYIRAFEPVVINEDGETSRVWLRIFGDSIWYAFLTTVICLVVGYPVAYFIGRSPEKWRNFLLTLIMIPFWTSFLIRTYAWITILSKDGLANGLLMATGLSPQPVGFLFTPFAVILGLVYTYLPFMILPIYASVEKLDGSMIEAAYDLGANTIETFFKVVIPLTRPGIIAGILLVFVPSVGMFAVSTLMGGGTNPTIGEVIHNQFTRARNQPFGAALGTMLLGLFLLSLWLGSLLHKDKEESR